MLYMVYPTADTLDLLQLKLQEQEQLDCFIAADFLTIKHCFNLIHPGSRCFMTNAITVLTI